MFCLWFAGTSFSDETEPKIHIPNNGKGKEQEGAKTVIKYTALSLFRKLAKEQTNKQTSAAVAFLKGNKNCKRATLPLYISGQLNIGFISPCYRELSLRACALGHRRATVWLATVPAGRGCATPGSL